MAIANTITNLVPTIFRAMHTVSRENVGAIMGVTLDAQAAAAAVGQTVRTPIAPAAELEDVTPSMAIPETGGQTISHVDMTLTRSKAVSIPISGEEELGLGTMADVVMEQRIAQALGVITSPYVVHAAILVREVEDRVDPRVSQQFQRLFSHPRVAPSRILARQHLRLRLPQTRALQIHPLPSDVQMCRCLKSQ